MKTHNFKFKSMQFVFCTILICNCSGPLNFFNDSNDHNYFDHLSISGDNVVQEGNVIKAENLKISFLDEGITIQAQKIKLNKKENTFETKYLSGKLLPQKIEITLKEDINIKCHGDHAYDFDKPKVILKGNAFIATEYTKIEANEIILIKNGN